MAGYSGTPVPKKLGIGVGTTFATAHAPEDFDTTLGDLPDGATWRRRVRPKLDVVVAFHTARAAMVREWPKLTAAVDGAQLGGCRHGRSFRNLAAAGCGSISRTSTGSRRSRRTWQPGHQ